MTKAIGPVPFAKEGEVKVGSVLRTDSGFTCMPDGAEKTVYRGEPSYEGDKCLYVSCEHGGHALDVQLEDGEYVGLYLVRS